ncbi:Lrp/AsnC family transcriptional regulator [Candidatus Bathyarchaeota archaeon]|nr:Lrp/AsnC family transcriptional regulator [Candidatus Bathyarchaeota archaeon]
MNLRLLKRLCTGNGLSINLSYLSRHLRKHRNTIRERVRELTRNEVIDRPVFPFLALFKECPILVAVYADLPDDEKVQDWLRTDNNIFAAFRVREGEYNMMLFELHKSLWSYHTWREAIVREGKIPGRGERVPSTALYLSNELIEKYEPQAPVQLITEGFKNGQIREINGVELDDLTLDILTHLVNGEGISVNENLIAKELGVHRRTVSERVRKLIDAGVIMGPVCRFPSFFVPPNFLLIFSLIELRRDYEKFIREIHSDPHVSLAYRISEGRYNVLLFEAHLNLENYLKWESSYSAKFPNCFGSIKNTYLSPRMTISIDQQKVSLSIIEEKLRTLEKTKSEKRRSKVYLKSLNRKRWQR